MKPSQKHVIALLAFGCLAGCSRNPEKVDELNTTNMVAVSSLDTPLTDEGNTTNATLLTPADAPVVPDHNFSFRDGSSYGYIGGISDEDRKNGKAAGDVFMITYLGHWGEAYHLAEVNDAGQMTSNYECGTNCIAIKSYRYGTVRRIAYAPESLIGAAFQDAMRGRLRERPKEVQAPRPYVPPPATYSEPTASVEPVANNETSPSEQQ